MKLKHNNNHLYSYLIGLLLLVSPLSSVYAAVVIPDLLLTPVLKVTSPGRVLMVDGLDAGVTVNITAIDGTLPLARYDFGFVAGGNYNLITNQFGSTIGSFTFTGGTAVDFALRDRGADSVSTADDVIYSISNTLDYADQWYYDKIDPSNSSNPKVTSPYYRTLAILWDLNRDGVADTGFSIGVSTPVGGTDGVAPISVTTVPLPAAVWLLGTGLLGMVGGLRRKKAG